MAQKPAALQMHSVEWDKAWGGYNQVLRIKAGGKLKRQVKKKSDFRCAYS